MDLILSPQFDLAFQIAILIILLVSMLLKKKRRHLLHGMTILFAFAFNMLSFLLVMVPSLLGLVIIRNAPLHVVSIVAFAHMTLGVIAIACSLLLIASWRLRSTVQGCVKRRKVMRIALVLWLSTLVVGILIYLYLNTNLIQ